MPYEFFIGGRYLKSKKKQAFISLITILSISGITIGVMALIIVIAVMTGAESEFRARILGVESHILLMRYNGAFDNYRKVLKDIRNIKGVKNASLYIYAQIMLRSSSRVAGAVLRGIEPDASVSEIENFDKKSLRKELKTSQNSLSSGSVPGIILGKELAKTLFVTKGDPVYLISPKGMLSPIGHIPTMKRFVVTGLFESGMYQYDASLAFINLKEAQKILRMHDSVTGIGIRVNNIYESSSIAADIAKYLNSKYPHGSFGARDWTQMNYNLFSALKLEKKAMFVILTLIVLVAAFNISSSLIMMVMGKTRDIAILKAMGASHKSIKKIFIFQGMVIGLIGTTLGISLGFLGCILLKHYKFIELPGDVYYFTTLPVQLETVDVLFIASAALIISFLATLYPASQASKLDPVEAIRYG